MNSVLIKVWVQKDDPEFKLYSFGENFKELQIHGKDFPVIRTLIGNGISEVKRKPSDFRHYHFRIALHYSNEIETFNVHQPDVDYFQGKIGDGIRDGSKGGAEFSPIIHLLQEDITDFLSDSYTKEHGDAPRFRYIIDSGIWNYLSTNQDDFKNDIKDIVSNWEKGFYDLYIAREFAELNARLTKASYLYERPDSQGGGSSGHGAAVSPFLFHSETLIKNQQKENTAIEEYRWRFLLLDDKIDKNKTEIIDNVEKKTGILSSNDPKKELTKAEILKYRIEQIGKWKCECILANNLKTLPSSSEHDIQIICVETIDKAIELMQDYEFDIILLDYLLQNNHYGYELLTKINGKEGGASKVLCGPQGKNFFMFISAFTTAVNERLTLEGLSRDEDWWLIGEGACPTNTPELFRYRLIHLMERRLNQTGIRELSIENVLTKVLEIFKKDEQMDDKISRIESVRERAYKAYHEILGFHYDYYNLREKDKGHSVLVDSFMKKQVHLGAMLEHLLQLVHLTAFGTVRQWPEIWEEYQFFTRTVNDSHKYKNLMGNITESIEEHIIDLKSE